MKPFFRAISILVLGMLAMQVSGQNFQNLLILSSDTAFAGQEAEFRFSDPDSFNIDQTYVYLMESQHRHDTIYPKSISSDGFVIIVNFDIPFGLASSQYTFRLFPYNGSTPWQYEGICLLSKPSVITQPKDILCCYNDEVVFEPEALGSDIEFQWYHEDMPLEGETNSFLQLKSVQYADTGSYYCVLKNAWGEDTAKAILSIYPYQDQVGKAVGSEQECMGAESSDYLLPGDLLVDSYTWKLLPSEAGVLTSSGREVSILWSQDYAGVANLFAETGFGTCDGPNSDTLDISMVGPSGTPEICIVGMDETSGFYRLVWNKIDDGSIIAYNIYRESNQAGVYLKLKTMGLDDFTVLVDSSSSPSVIPHSYKITYSDTCGNESDFSGIHKTIHLTANVGAGGENNLSWNHYEGFAFLSYEIMRGTSPDSLEFLRAVSSNVTSFSDTNPPAGQVFYQIAVSRDGACFPSKKSSDYSRSMSNMYEINGIGISESWTASGLKIYPNPASGFVNIDFSGAEEQFGTIALFDLSGRQLAFYEINGEAIRIETDGLENGIYLLKVSMKGICLTKRLMISH